MEVISTTKEKDHKNTKKRKRRKRSKKSNKKMNGTQDNGHVEPEGEVVEGESKGGYEGGEEDNFEERHQV